MLIEPLRLECRPRQSTGDFCKGHIIAKSLLTYLMFAEMGLMPPGRQQEMRSYRIALCCPIQRPDTVPPTGCYWPLPPDWAREQAKNGAINDNYLYFTYHHDGKVYEEGVWVYEKRDFKTKKCHGVRINLVPNFRFEDGKCFYDYFEQYLCGLWYSGACKNGQRYTWWDSERRGDYGKWRSLGRAEFCTEKTPLFVRSNKAEDWVSSYLFIVPATGRQFSDGQLSDLFGRVSFRVIYKRMTPHTFRYVWATFGCQSGLSDAQLRSLAVTMGCTLETLRRMYERTSPTEKNRPIQEIIQLLLKPYSQSQDDDAILADIKAKIPRLSPAQREELRRFLNAPPPS